MVAYDARDRITKLKDWLAESQSNVQRPINPPGCPALFAWRLTMNLALERRALPGLTKVVHH
jgi:hypothetical protein